MSKLTEIKKDLYANSDIIVVGIKIINNIPKRDCWSETVNIVVAPKEGVYEADKLQLLMEELVLSVKRCDQDRFYGEGGPLSIGVLYFDEEIGTETNYACREIVLTDNELLARDFDEFVDGKQLTKTASSTYIFRRRTWVRLYPDLQIALQVIRNGKNEYRIEKEKMIKHRDLLSRVISNLSL